MTLERSAQKWGLEELEKAHSQAMMQKVLA
jgi:hypothetical protein